LSPLVLIKIAAKKYQKVCEEGLQRSKQHRGILWQEGAYLEVSVQRYQAKRLAESERSKRADEIE